MGGRGFYAGCLAVALLALGGTRASAQDAGAPPPKPDAAKPKPDDAKPDPDAKPEPEAAKPEPDAAEPDAGKPKPKSKPKEEDDYPRVSGSFYSRARARYTHREGDQDVFTGLQMTVAFSKGIELHVDGDLFVDAGRDRSRHRNELDDIWDSWDRSAQGRMQELYLRITQPVLGGLEVRAGRQVHLGNQALHFDGLWASLALNDTVTVRGYGGLPVYFYKSPWRGDVLAGGAVDLHLTPTTDLTLEYLHVSEGQRHGGFRHDDLYALSGRQVLWRRLTLRARGEVLEDEVRSAEANATLALGPADLGAVDLQLRGRYYVLFDKQQQLTNTIDPFTDLLAPENPYQSAQASLFLGIGGVVGAELFYTYRDVIDTADENLWNHDYHRYGGGFHVYDVPVKGLTLSVTFENWEVEGRGGADTRQVSGELDLRLNDVVRLSGGTTYLLYKYDLLARRTREDVRVFFARLRLRWKDHRLDVSYQLEHDSLDDFHVVRVGYRHDF